MEKVFNIHKKDITVSGDVEGDIDRYVGEVLIGEEYKQCLGNDRVVLDIGANLGTFSLWIYDYAKVIYAVEAQKDNFANLKRTVKINKLDKIKPSHLAIAGSSGIGHLSGAGDCGGYHLTGDTSSEEVETITLNSFLLREKIKHVDIMKIDVEGAELDILLASDFSEAAKKIPLIIGECHIPNLPDLLAGRGYDFTPINYNLFLAKRV